MTRTRLDLFSSLDGRSGGAGVAPDAPMGKDWPALTAAYSATRTFRARVLGDTSGAGSTGIDDRYVAASFEGIGAEILGAAMFGLHSHADDPDWRGWWGDDPPFHTPVFVLTHDAPRASLAMAGGTTFHFRDAPVEAVLAEAAEAAGGRDVRIGGGIGVARAFLRAGLVDELHLTITPIITGRGVHIWDDVQGLEQTHDVATEVAESGTIHVTFTRREAGPTQ